MANVTALEWEAVQAHVKELSSQIESSEQANTYIFLFIASANILLMQAGFTLLEVGTVQAKNAKSMLFKNVIDCCIGVILWWLIGYNISHKGFKGWNGLGNIAREEIPRFFHSYAYSVTCITIVSGGVAERISFAAYMVLSVAMSGLFYPCMAFLCWNEDGWVKRAGFVDFAGVTVIHVLGGTASMAAAAQLGPRIGRFSFNAEKKMLEVIEFKGHSPVLSTIGTIILLFGWFSFNASASGSAKEASLLISARAAANTMLSSAAGALSGFCWQQYKSGVHDSKILINNLLAGAVAITGCCAYVDFWAAALIGNVSSVFYSLSSYLMLSLHIDDPLDTFAIHGGAGIWGTLAVGIFSKYDYLDAGQHASLLEGGTWNLLAAQFLGLGVIFAWSGLTVTLLLRILDPILPLRVCVDTEILGLDFAYHEGFAYPDFSRQVLREKRMREAEANIMKKHSGLRLKKPKTAADILLRVQPWKKSLPKPQSFTHFDPSNFHFRRNLRQRKEKSSHLEYSDEYKKSCSYRASEISFSLSQKLGERRKVVGESKEYSEKENGVYYEPYNGGKDEKGEFEDLNNLLNRYSIPLDPAIDVPSKRYSPDDMMFVPPSDTNPADIRQKRHSSLFQSNGFKATSMKFQVPHSMHQNDSSCDQKESESFQRQENSQQNIADNPNTGH